MIIEVNKLTKDFRADFWKKKKRVLSGVSFNVEKGSVYGFLGPNGAGKTTTIKALMGLIFPTSGNARILGSDISKVQFKKKVGYLPESPYFYDYLKAGEFLSFYGDLFGLPKKEVNIRMHKLLEDVGLKNEKNVQLRKFSRGMLQRVGLAQALINDPELLILDEPMSGLDPIGRKNIRDIILKSRDEGKTIFFSSHILSDVEMICDQVSIIVGGRIVDSGYIRDLLNPKILFYEIQFDKNSKNKLGEDFIKEKEGQFVERGKNLFIKAMDDESLRQISSALINRGVDIVSVLPVKETLEDLFVKKVESNGV